MSGFISAVVTARVLGPEGMGTLSALLFIAALLSYACSLGLGDAAIVLIRSKEASIEQALASSFLPLAGTITFGCAVLAFISWVADWSAIMPAVMIAAGFFGLSTFLRVLVALENARERLKMTSVIFAVNAVTATLGAVLFVGVLKMSISGGALAAFCGSISAIALATWDMRRRSISLRGSVSGSYLKKALRFGIPAEAAYILVALSQRLDLLIVYALIGEADAGRYTVALTLGQLAAYGPFALATASFPRLAGMAAEDVSGLIGKLSRVTLSSAMCVGVVLLVAIPLGVVRIFGHGFQDAIGPAPLLTVGSVVWSEQWLLARAAAARGFSWLYFGSFGSSLLVMIALDLLLVPRFGIMGAAVASTGSATVGLGICLPALLRRSNSSLTLRQLVPTFTDVRETAMWLRAFSSARAQESSEMHVLFVIDDGLDHNGRAVTLKNWAPAFTALFQRGVSLDVVSLRGSVLDEAIRSLGGTHVSLSSTMKVPLSKILLLRERMLAHRYSLIHANEVVPSLMVGLARTRRRFPPVIFHRQHERSGGAHRFLSRTAARLSDLTFAISAAVAEAARELDGTPEERIVLVPSGTSELRRVSEQETAALRADLSIPSRAPVIVSVSRLRREKGLHVLVEAAGRLARAHYPLHLVLVGDGPEASSLREQGNELPDLAVHLVGHDSDVARWYALADVVAVPSLSEGFGLTVIEAMACRRAVVASDGGGPALILGDRKAGLLVPREDAAALADGIASLLEDPARARRMGNAAYELYLERYTLDAMVDRWVAGYEELLVGK